MADITISNLFANVIKETNLGYIRVVYVGEGNVGTERMVNNLTAEEVYSLLNKTAKSYYKIGEYWTITV